MDEFQWKRNSHEVLYMYNLSIISVENQFDGGGGGGAELKYKK